MNHEEIAIKGYYIHPKYGKIYLKNFNEIQDKPLRYIHESYGNDFILEVWQSVITKEYFATNLK